MTSVGSSDSRAGANVSPETQRIAVSVTRDALRQIRAGHPWVFDGSITRVKPPSGLSIEDLRAGDLAVIFDDKSRFAAIGLYDPGSPIRIRILHAGRPIAIDGDFFARRLGEVAQSRFDAFDDSETNGYRLVHGENDGLPGLVIDRFADSAVIKVYSSAWLPYLEWVLDGTVALLRSRPSGVARVVLRLSRSVAGDAGSLARPSSGLSQPEPFEDGQILFGQMLDQPTIFKENGLRFEADVVNGHKTGFFLDQRDNRRLIRSISRGANVLDVFSFSGGFSVSAAAGGARSVHSVDLNPWAIEATTRNVELNHRIRTVRECRFESTVGDARQVLEQLRSTKQRFDVVVVDPPSFASNRRQVPAAVRAYSELAGLACSVLKPGGSLFQASCSARIDRISFQQAVIEGAHRAGYSLVEIRETGQPVDHPIGFAQGEYLKGMLAGVERNR